MQEHPHFSFIAAGGLFRRPFVDLTAGGEKDRQTALLWCAAVPTSCWASFKHCVSQVKARARRLVCTRGHTTPRMVCKSSSLYRVRPAYLRPAG